LNEYASKHYYVVAIIYEYFYVLEDLKQRFAEIMLFIDLRSCGMLWK
jgi:hypothetical protein